LVMIVKAAERLEWSLAKEAAMEYMLANSWFRLHWKESTADISR
jgi:hypothetical protein